jgi:glycosidase
MAAFSISARATAGLIDGLHQRGMRLIMDAVLNHVGTEHSWFQAARRGEKPYRDFFTFLPDGKYLCWWGFDTLPELRLEHPLLARLLYRDPDSVLQRWLRELRQLWVRRGGSAPAFVRSFGLAGAQAMP